MATLRSTKAFEQIVGANKNCFNWIGTKAEYDSAVASGIIQEHWLCFITDDTDTQNVSYKTLSICQNSADISNMQNDIIYLLDNCTTYIDTPSTNRNYRFDTTKLSNTTNKVICFEILIHVGSTLFSFDFTDRNQIFWINGIEPAINETNTYYLLVFKSYDGGQSFVGSLSATWQATQS